MSAISPEVMDLEKSDIKAWPRLERLRKAHFDEKSEICLELARNTTLFFRNNRPGDNGDTSAELTAGRLYQFVLGQKDAIINDESLLAGTTTTKQKGVVLYPHFLALTIWPELETISKRQKNPFQISNSDWKELNGTIFPFWMNGTMLETVRSDFGVDGQTPPSQTVMERIAFFLASKAYCISHTIPNYEIVLQKGLRAIIDDAHSKERGLRATPEDRARRDFYQAVRLGLGGIIAYAANLSIEAERQAAILEQKGNSARAAELRVMSEYLTRVPAEPPQTLQEAVNALWICKVALHQENANVALSVGRLDQILYPFYKMDSEKGRITPKEAVELVGCLWLKMADHIPLVPEASEELFGGTASNQAVTLGGIDRAGNDAVNDLTYVMLHVTQLLRLRDPNVNARFHPEKNTKDYRDRLVRLNLETRATPCYHNDLAVVDLLETQGIAEEDARDYGAVGCVEPTSCGRTFGATGTCLFNLTSVLELTLFGGRHRLTGLGQDDPLWQASVAPESIQSFAMFKSVFESHLDWLIGHAVDLNNKLGLAHRKLHPTPMLSALMEGCLEQGMDVVDGGAKYNSSGVAVIGLAEVVDSVTAIEEFVFAENDTNRIPLPGMIGAINTNWGAEETDPAKAACYQKYHVKVKNSLNKFGYDQSSLAMDNALWLTGMLHEKFQSCRNYRGGPIRSGTGQ